MLDLVTLFGSLPKLHMTHKSSKSTKNTICPLMKAGDFQGGIMPPTAPWPLWWRQCVVFLEMSSDVFAASQSIQAGEFGRDHIFRFPLPYLKIKNEEVAFPF